MELQIDRTPSPVVGVFQVLGTGPIKSMRPIWWIATSILKNEMGEDRKHLRVSPGSLARICSMFVHYHTHTAHKR